MTHSLLDHVVVQAVERAVHDHLGEPWNLWGFISLDHRAAHPAGVLRGTCRGAPFPVFAKLGAGTGSRDQFAAELRGLGLISRLAQVRTPVPVGAGIIELGAAAPGTDGEGRGQASWLLLLEAVPERSGCDRSSEDLEAIGRTLAALHQVRGRQFGLPEFDTFFGPIQLDNRPVPSNRWADFYAERRVRPILRLAADSGNLPAELTSGVDDLIRRLPGLCGEETSPRLLHGDAQQNNFLCSSGSAAAGTAASAVVIDPAPYYGHPEVDLALLDYFEPVPRVVFDAYREVMPLSRGFAERRELWRIFAYLAVVGAADRSPLGRQFLDNLAAAVRRYR